MIIEQAIIIPEYTYHVITPPRKCFLFFSSESSPQPLAPPYQFSG